MEPSGTPLGIIAGGGQLPARVADAAIAAGRKVVILGLEGQADAAITPYPHHRLKWGEFGRFKAILEENGVRDLVLAGAIGGRPQLDQIHLDWLAIKSLPKVVAFLMGGGDDSVLSGAIKFIEGFGYRVVGPHEIARDLVAEPGCLTRHQPSRDDRDSIGEAARAALTIGRLDAGQAAVSVGRHVIALEGVEGTDAMLERVKTLHENGRARWKGRAGALAKWSKPQQDLRVDLPTIGPRTVERVAAAGLAGVAIEARRVMILDRAETIEAADAAGLFIVAEAGIAP
jgi:DUF1009 family protein